MRDLAGLLCEGVRRFPDRPQGWRSLSHLLSCLGRPVEAIEYATEALDLFPGDVELTANRIAAHIQRGDVDAALGQAKGLLSAGRDDAVAGRAYLDALKAAGLWDELDRAAQTMNWLTSDSMYWLEILGRRLLRIEDRPGDMLAHCDAILARAPGHTNATYFRAVSLARSGRDAEACEAMGLERYLSISDLSVPDGYRSGAEFRAALAAEIRANPTLLPDPKLKTTRDGLQTLQLRQPGEKAVGALIAALETAVLAYADRLADDGGPFAKAAPAFAEIQSWAVVYGGDGRQAPHRHPGGWLSGVYYVDAPKPADETAYRGLLKLGMVGKALDAEPPWGIHAIEPIPGRLVLFPSFTPHATEPTGTPGARICVAFDVVPSRSVSHAARPAGRGADA